MHDYGATTITTSASRARVVDRWFYIGMAIATVFTVILGFGPSIVNTAGRNAPLTSLAKLHAAAYAAWLLVFFAQATLAATRRIPTHRRLGTAAMILLPIMIVTGYLTAIAMARRGFDLSGDLHIESDPALGVVNPLGDLLLFTLLVIAAYCYRRRREVHKRLMLLATVGGLMPAPLAHFIGHIPAISGMPPIILGPLALLIFASAAYDRASTGRIHPVSLWGALVILAWFLLLNGVIGPSAVWHQFVRWAAT